MAKDFSNEDIPEPSAEGRLGQQSKRERRQGPRSAMILSAEIEDLINGTRLAARTSDLSVHGCYLDTLNPYPAGTRIRIHLKKDSQTFQSLGLVIYAHEGLGMGVAFLQTEAEQQEILQQWIGSPT